MAVVADYLEEQWPSMDLVADMLFQFFQEDQSSAVDAKLVRPRLKRRFSRLQVVPGPSPRNADRFIGRFVDYPRHLSRLRADFDLFHIVDHSYAHLVLGLPAHRSVVTCNDLDAFRCLREPAGGSAILRAMARRTLAGLRAASRVLCISQSTHDELVDSRFVAKDRLRVVPLGVHPTFRREPDPTADNRAAAVIGAFAGQNLEILHVGSTIPRKRIDVLLRTFAAVQASHPGARLLRVGGDLTPFQSALARELGVEGAIVTLPPLDRSTLAAVYRRAALLLLPSEREGFGLPVIEALACGLPVLASDIGALREVGGDAVAYARDGVVKDWVRRTELLLRERLEEPIQWEQRRRRGADRAAGFTWSETARKTVAVYSELLV